jgi:thioredoxin 1
MGNATLTFTDENFEMDVISSDKPVLVDFWAAWCGPCRVIAPIIDEIAQEHQATLKVGKLDVDANAVAAQTYEVFSIPTLILFIGGKPVKRIVGGMSKERIMAELQPHVAQLAG